MTAEYERRRNQEPGRKLIMSRRWRTESKAFLALPGNGVCHHCRAAPATMVDHRTAHRGNPSLFWHRGNWVPSCRPCNSSKAGQIEGGFGNVVKPGAPVRRRPIRGCEADGRPSDPLHPWNQGR